MDSTLVQILAYVYERDHVIEGLQAALEEAKKRIEELEQNLENKEVEPWKD